MMNNERQAGTKAATLMLNKFKRPASFFAMLLLWAVFSCKQPKKENPVNISPSIVKMVYKPNIYQDIWHDGNYHLQTVVFTDSNQMHPRVNTNSITNYTAFAPYSHEVSGTFEYIKNIKKAEYTKAHNYLFEIPDSVSILKRVLVK